MQMDTLYLRMTRIIENSTYQEKVIEYLRTFGFKFIPYRNLLEITSGQNLQDIDRNPGMTFMVRHVKWDIWDTRLILGIKLNGKKREKITVYYKEEHWKTLTKLWKDEADINFRKTINKVIFPDFMTYDERRRWRTLNQKLKKNPEFKPGDWYYKCEPSIKWIDIPK